MQGALLKMMKISEAVASSVCHGIADDALKDEDNGVWLVDLPPQTQALWQQRFYWIRWVDRLAEQDQIVQPGGQQFPAFYQAWKDLQQQRFLSPQHHQWEVLQQIESAWFQPTAAPHHQAQILAWDCYIEAISEYHQPQLTIKTLQGYETMLDRLAGSCFQLLPQLADHQRLISRQFGMVDQFYNNLRDLYEDAQQGVCYFPTELLTHFGLTRQHILDLSCLNHSGYRPLMQFWVEQYLPQWRRQNLSLIQVNDLHPAWQALTRWFIHRYTRIESVLRDCQYDFVEFAEHYWPVVEQDLAHYRIARRQH